MKPMRASRTKYKVTGMRAEVICLLATYLVFAIGAVGRAAEQDAPPVEYNRQMDVVYGYKDGMGLIMDVLTSKQHRNGAGILLVISGGLRSNPADFRKTGDSGVDPHTAALLGSGYVVFRAFHGSQPKYTLPEVQQDMRRAVRFIRHHADRFGIDRDRIGVIGSSSGGDLALHLATSAPGPDPLTADPIDKESSKVQAAVAYFPPTDLVNFGGSNTTIQEHLHVNAPFDFRKWDDKAGVFVKVTDPEGRRAIFERCSPITHVSKDDPPSLLLHGDQDNTVPVQQSKVFLQRMKGLGAVCQLIEVPGKGHGWNPPVEGELGAVTGWFDRWLLRHWKQ